MSAASVRDDLAVVLCTYNGSEHVEEQVLSILAQAILPGEIRVYDDGSRDDTVQLVVRTWQHRGPRAGAVRLYIAPEAAHSFGASKNFERAMLDTPQPIIALSDQDDVWTPDRVAAALEVLDEHPELDLVASDAVMTDGSGQAVGRTVFESQRLTRTEREQFRRHEYLPAILRRNLFPGMTLTVRRSLIERLGPLPLGAMHDYWAVAAAAATGRMRVIPRPLVRYRIHGGNAVGLDTGRRSLAERVQTKARAFRAPLTDLPQWLELPDRVLATGEVEPANLLREKARFEVARRFPVRSPLARVRSIVGLLRSDDYVRFEFQGRGAALRDALRRPDPYLQARQ